MSGEVALRALCKTTSGEEASVRPLSPYARCRRTPVVSYLAVRLRVRNHQSAPRAQTLGVVTQSFHCAFFPRNRET